LPRPSIIFQKSASDFPYYNIEKIYKAKFWKDQIWVTLIPGILGLIFLLVGLAATTVGILQIFKDKSVFLGFLGAFLILILPMLFVGGVCFYIFLYGIMTKIIINDEFLILDAPLYKKKVPIINIKKVAIKQKNAPIITHSGIGSAPVFFKATTINVIFEKQGIIKALKLPCWRKGYYLPQIIENLKKINPRIQS